MISVAVIDDDPIVLEWLEGKAETDTDLTVVGSANSVDDLVARLSGAPDVIVLDVMLKNGTRLADNIMKLRKWGAQVVVISNDDRSHEMRRVAMRKGYALAFVNKKAGYQGVRSAIISAAAGEMLMDPQQMDFIVSEEKVQLSRREEEIARYIADGLSNIEIKNLLTISVDTVKEHVQNIRRKYLSEGRPAETRNELITSLRNDGRQSDW